MYRRPFLCTLAVAGALTLAPAAHAAGWAGSPPLSPPDRVATGVRVALLPGGVRVVAWIQQSPNRVTADNVSVRVAEPTGDFPPARTFPGDASTLRLVTGDDGSSALVWATSDHRIHVARRGANETSFTEATPLLVSEGQLPGDLDAAIVGGNVYVAFDAISTFLQTTKTSIHVARLAAAESTVKDVVGTNVGLIARETFTNPAPTRSVDTPRLATKPDGTVSVAFEVRTSAAAGGHGLTSVQADTLDAGAAAFGAPSNLVLLEGATASAPRADIAAASGGGHRYVVWDSGFRTPIAYRDLDGSLNPIAVPADPATSLRAGADGAGTLFVGSTGQTAADRQNVVAATLVRVGATPDTTRRLTPTGIDRRMDDLVVASDGTALALANLDTFGSRGDPQAVLRTPGAAFGAPEHVAGLQDIPDFNAEPAAAAVAPGGRALVAWVGSDHTTTANARVHVSERDTTAPGFGEIAVPATAVVGQPAGFAAAASDTLSGTTLSWDFGDGSHADGNVVSHTFGEPGPATVTVTATDEAGNSASQSRVVAIAAAPSGPGQGGGGGDGPGAPPPDTVNPTVSGAKLTNVRFRVAKGATAVVARARRTKAAPTGTTLRLNVSERSTVAVAIGRRKIVRGTLVRAGVAPGKVSIPFSGRLGKTALPAGSYTAAITAIDGAGNRSKAVIVKFTIVKK
jgi:hypothetical protein